MCCSPRPRVEAPKGPPRPRPVREAIRLFPLLLAHPRLVEEGIRAHPLALPVEEAARVTEEAQEELAEREEPEGQEVAAGMFKCLVLRRSPRQCSPSCKHWACWTKALAPTATSRTEPPTRRDRNRSPAG